MKKKKHFSSPLPFRGQKRYFVNEFIKALKECSDTATFVDVFGGSGLLSHIVKQEKPNARVIWNDFDDFKKRLDNVDTTNELMENNLRTQDCVNIESPYQICLEVYLLIN